MRHGNLHPRRCASSLGGPNAARGPAAAACGSSTKRKTRERPTLPEARTWWACCIRASVGWTTTHPLEGGVFPVEIETCTDPAVARWLERTIKVLPVAPRPADYEPLAAQNLDPAWIARLGKSGRACWDAILGMDAAGLGESMNECMRCWEALLPHVVRPPGSSIDLTGLLAYYQGISHGAMFSGCGGGYFYVVSEAPVPGTFPVQVRARTP